MAMTLRHKAQSRVYFPILQTILTLSLWIYFNDTFLHKTSYTLCSRTSRHNSRRLNAEHILHIQAHFKLNFLLGVYNVLKFLDIFFIQFPITAEITSSSEEYTGVLFSFLIDNSAISFKNQEILVHCHQTYLCPGYYVV